MTTCLEKGCSFRLPRVPFVYCCQFMYSVISLLVLRALRIWDLIVSVPDHCLSFYFPYFMFVYAFAGRLCDKYHILISWLKCDPSNDYKPNG